MKEVRLVCAVLFGLYLATRIRENRRFIQHGNTTTYRHCRNVAYVSLRLSRRLRLAVDERSLVRGALLHDYYLYDWHRKGHPRWHGFVHPQIALRNASAVCDLTPVERDVISRHMFPLTPLPPRTKEGWLVCLCDKLCSLHEVIHGFGGGRASQKSCSE